MTRQTPGGTPSVDPPPARGAPRTVVDSGRRKAYRPLAAPARAVAFEAAIAAYERGDYFEAHELLEPAWMGTDDALERNLYQGLIKLSAAYVHWARGNPSGVHANLRGARERLANVVDGEGDPRGLDLPPLLAAIDAQLEEAEHVVAERSGCRDESQGWAHHRAPGVAEAPVRVESPDRERPSGMGNLSAPPLHRRDH